MFIRAEAFIGLIRYLLWVWLQLTSSKSKTRFVYYIYFCSSFTCIMVISLCGEVKPVLGVTLSRCDP